MAKICISAGHGGIDPGAVDGKDSEHDNLYTEESDVNLETSKNLKDILENRGHKIVMIRNDDSDVSLYKRAKIANENQCDYFVSIHYNASRSAKPHGSQVIHYPGSATGNKLATNINTWLKKYGKRDSYGVVSRDDLYVLENTIMPAILIEVAFLTNTIDEKLANSKGFRFLMAQCIANGIQDTIEGKNSNNFFQ